MYVRGPQHSITGEGSPQYIQVGGGGIPPTLPGLTPMSIDESLMFSIRFTQRRIQAQIRGGAEEGQRLYQGGQRLYQG